MRTIAELNVLLRVRAVLPAGIKLATVDFREGWNFVRSGNARRLERKIQAQGWNFIKTPDGSLRSGVGDTSQEAIASALKLALRRVGKHFNAAEVERIEMTQYPWFFLARVRVYPFRIQQEAVLPVPDEAWPAQTTLSRRRLPPHAAELYPFFGSATPMLKQMLAASRVAETRF
jgi:hypothetical protein